LLLSLLKLLLLLVGPLPLLPAAAAAAWRRTGHGRQQLRRSAASSGCACGRLARSQRG
jgi:hypothetical protein